MKHIILIFILSVTTLFAVDAKMEIVKKSNNLPTIVVSTAVDNSDKFFVNKISDLIIEDLKVSGHFDLSKVEYSNKFLEKPNMLFLSQNGIDLYLNIFLEPSAFEGLNLKVKLYDVNQKIVVLNKSISSSKLDRYPFVAHRTAILVNKHLNAPSIDWMDKFVVFSIYQNAKKSDIAIGDYTLTYKKTLIKGGLNIFPKWADKKQESFYYTTYNSGTPEVRKFNIYTRQRQKIMSSDGMVAVSDVSSDGNKLLITASPSGQPDIYLYDVRTKIKKRLTKYKGIDVSGNFVENDKKIVFVSDRLKYPNIFAKTIGKRGVERLVFHGRNNSSASTYKNYVVYSSRDKENEFSNSVFNLYLISTTSDFIRRLTTNGSNQFPKFSNDGESILFIKRINGKSSLGIIRLNYEKSFLFPLKHGKLQSIDW